MALLLPHDDPARDALMRRGVHVLRESEAEGPGTAPRLRIGIINLMPEAEAYEPMLLTPLGLAAYTVEPVWLRLDSHGYASSDLSHLTRFYRRASAVLANTRLDGLIVTGAPVEELPFEQVRYWSELRELLSHAQSTLRSTLGLCWGGMALAKLLGLEKHSFARKLFGVYPLTPVPSRHPLLRGSAPFACAQSRHSGIAEAILSAAEQARIVRLLAHSPEAGHSIFESEDRRFLVHLGHPEYTPARLGFEYRRDRELGRSDVPLPAGVDLAQPAAAPLPHGRDFFAAWLAELTVFAGERS
ncbi:MAG: metA [Myxococcaceae bacterium]|nr:metA [Myxococcaceae bacterium]